MSFAGSADRTRRVPGFPTGPDTARAGNAFAAFLSTGTDTWSQRGRCRRSRRIEDWGGRPAGKGPSFSGVDRV